MGKHLSLVCNGKTLVICKTGNEDFWSIEVSPSINISIAFLISPKGTYVIYFENPKAGKNIKLHNWYHLFSLQSNRKKCTCLLICEMEDTKFPPSNMVWVTEKVESWISLIHLWSLVQRRHTCYMHKWWRGILKLGEELPTARKN